MSAKLPEKLKFLNSALARSKELEKADPVISYYCKLYAVEEIIRRGLHQDDPEVAEFASQLMDEIETLRQESPALNSEQSQAILKDDVAAQAYIEGFATKVFAKADREVRDHKTTKGTPGTFLASVTFFELLKVFGDTLEKDISDKIKYAKYHAARILKAFKTGEDPNLYEPPEDGDEEKQLNDELHELEVEQNHGTGIDHTEQASSEPSNEEPSQPVLPSAPATQPVAPRSFSQSPPISAPLPAKSVTVEDVKKIMNETEKITSAQKHAKFAISALNYEDKDTAIKELTKALELLQ